MGTKPERSHGILMHGEEETEEAHDPCEGCAMRIMMLMVVMQEPCEGCAMMT